MRIFIACLLVSAALMAAPVPAAAQQDSDRPAFDQTSRRPTVVRRPEPVGFAAYFLADWETMTATRSFEAVVGQSTLSGYGFGGDILRLWRQAFARVTYSRMTRSGSRVVAAGTDSFPVHIPLDVTMTPLEIAGGWQFPQGRAAKQWFTPYAGGGIVFLKYQEVTKQFGSTNDNSDETFPGYVLFGGVDFRIAKHVSAGAIAHYRSVPNALGTGGVSKEFKETDLGGFTLRFLVGVRN